ncbi:hypothetical protein BFW01_g565 [Lasiodiplodia theobromae]|nr:hypothetical protein BFW01_g565 [Lasiodiplodia theobromae]
MDMEQAQEPTPYGNPESYFTEELGTFESVFSEYSGFNYNEDTDGNSYTCEHYNYRQYPAGDVEHRYDYFDAPIHPSVDANAQPTLEDLGDFCNFYGGLDDGDLSSFASFPQ